MKARSDALKLLEMIKDTFEVSGFSTEVAIRAIAMQSTIFERIHPVLWEEASIDAREGLSLALPETKN